MIHYMLQLIFFLCVLFSSLEVVSFLTVKALAANTIETDYKTLWGEKTLLPPALEEILGRQ
jgi:hypothetical protein